MTLTATTTTTDTTTIIQTSTTTVFGTDIETQSVTNIQSAVQSVTVVQTSFSTTNSAGQIITQTFLVSSIAIGTAASAQSSSSSAISLGSSNNSNSPPTGAIVGGAVGGVALLAMIGLFVFTALRRGWFDKRDVNAAQGPVLVSGTSSSAVKEADGITDPQAPPERTTTLPGQGPVFGQDERPMQTQQFPSQYQELPGGHRSHY